MTDNNGWPGKPGVPLNPERDGWHWLKTPDGLEVPYDWRAAGECERGRWPAYWVPVDHDDWQVAECTYIGPALTPAEVKARGDNVRKDALEKAAKRLEELHKNHNYDPESGTLTKKLGRYDRWPESEKTAILEHDMGYYRAVAEGVAHILALAKVEGNA